MDYTGFSSVTSPAPLSVVSDSPQLATYSSVAGMFRRVRGDIKPVTARAEYRDTSVSNPHVDRPSGPAVAAYQVPKMMSGIGEFVLDPMQNLVPEKLDLEGYKYRSHIASPQKDTGGTSNIRRKGRAAYTRSQRNNSPYGKKLI